jgi:hypothetical protein
MIEQRHPSLRVTPVEVGEPIRWTATDAGGFSGRTDARGCWYVVGQLDDVWVAVRLSTVLGHGGTREHRETLRHCQTAADAQQACQDSEHRRAWDLLPAPARDLLLGLHGPVAA